MAENVQQDFAAVSKLPSGSVQRWPTGRVPIAKAMAGVGTFTRRRLGHDHEDRDQNDRREQLENELLQPALQSLSALAHDATQARGDKNARGR